MALRHPHPERERFFKARRIRVSACFCPACGHRLDGFEDFQCPSCQFTGSDSLRWFPFQAPALERISDHTHRLTRSEYQKIDSAITAFERKFPQFALAFVSVDLPPNTSLRVFAFWLLNASPCADSHAEARRSWTILLVASTSGEWALAPGYSAEAWLDARDWQTLLTRVENLSNQKSLAHAVVGFTRDCRTCLQEAWLKTQKRLSSRSARRSKNTAGPPP
ncbi:TPM domain-containing protein [Haloferula luteola]|uniref:TPM domain-containing protein n=1 Tax=Haloferula luteola TaxID=595692 RepID=UPI001C84887C|nr:TPM domain-containing protein [Haloferula luteola]